VTPRIVADDVEPVIAFLRAVFGATGDVVPGRPAELHIGESMVLVSSSEGRSPFPAYLYVYVDDADETYERAITAGARSIETPRDVPYGDRRAMVEDAAGNVYQIAHVLGS
jgi:uncharacterized glyoxalase superfamily protein PhnB